MYILIFFFIFFQDIQGMTFDQWDAYSKTIPEFPPLSNPEKPNWLDPDYDIFLETIRTSFIASLFQKIGIEFQKTWTPLFFKNVLKKVTENRIIKKYDYNTTALLTINQPVNIFVWGDTHAAFHSLLRGLSWLKEQNIIDPKGKILEKNTYFVFHGDQISRGPYSMETLSLIMQILDENPEHALYIKGNHESNGYWHNFGLKRELRIRALHLDNNFIPLSPTIKNFFKTLPNAFCINTEKESNHYIVFNFNGLEKPYIKKFSQSDQTEIRFEHHDSIYTKNLEEGSFVEAIIKTEEWTKQHRAKNGLGLLDQTFGATTWAVLSSPIEIHKKYYNLNNDAFCKIKIDPDIIRKSTIELYTHSLTDSSLQFKITENYNLITARALSHLQPEPQGSDIVIGSSLSLNQGVPIMGTHVKSGISIAINEQNRTGGIDGRHIRFFPLNDDYTPYKTRKNIDFYLKNNITDMLICSTGSPTLEGSIDYIKNRQIALIGPVTGDPLFANPELKGLVNITGSYDIEVESHLEILIKEHAAKNFAFFYQIEGLTAVMKTVRAVLERNGITQWLEIPYSRGSVNFQKESQKLKSTQIDAIGILAVSQAGQAFIREVTLEYLSTKKIFGHSFVGDESFHEFIKHKGLSIQLSTRIPNANTSDLEIVKQYREAMEKNGASYSADSLEGYMTARFLIDIMKECLPNINKDTILTKIESLKNFEWNGLTFNFDEKTRRLSNIVWIEKADGQIIQIN